MDVEEWRTITEYPSYEISSFGNVRVISTKQLRKLNISPSGYNVITLWNSETKKHSRPLFVHRLVAQEFIINPENKPTVNHIDKNRRNNCINNLEWNTMKEQHVHKDKTIPKKEFGNGNGIQPIQQINILTNQVEHEFNSITFAVDWLFKNGHTNYTELNQATIHRLRARLINAAKGRDKSAFGFSWKYKETYTSSKNEFWVKINPLYINNMENYEISTLGRIKNSKSNRILKTSKRQYDIISINKKNYPIHRLLALTFIKNDDPTHKTVVNHKDKNTHNFSLDNLEWVTPHENNIHKYMKYRKIVQYDINLKEIGRYDCYSDAENKTGINRHTISRCCRNLIHSVKGYIFKLE